MPSQPKNNLKSHLSWLKVALPQQLQQDKEKYDAATKDLKVEDVNLQDEPMEIVSVDARTSQQAISIHPLNDPRDALSLTSPSKIFSPKVSSPTQPEQGLTASKLKVTLAQTPPPLIPLRPIENRNEYPREVATPSSIVPDTSSRRITACLEEIEELTKLKDMIVLHIENSVKSSNIINLKTFEEQRNYYWQKITERSEELDRLRASQNIMMVNGGKSSSLRNSVNMNSDDLYLTPSKVPTNSGIIQEKISNSSLKNSSLNPLLGQDNINKAAGQVDEEDYEFSDIDAELIANVTPVKQVKHVLVENFEKSKRHLNEDDYNNNNNSHKDSIPKKPRLEKAPDVDSDLVYPWSREVLKALHQVFRLERFRENQLEAINAVLSGKDVFILMPTGGGKSLCYQLPACISIGKTSGITFVVSPLLSLMEDQREQLLKLGVPVLTLHGSMTATQRRFAFDQLSSPNTICKLVYVTPELLCRSHQVQEVIQQLYRNGRLARFVIDEAHCVSQWGHDFRPDYKQIGELKDIYPDIPTLALTATATAKVKMDVIQQLRIQGCKVFTQSFNRKNLYYEVRPKTKQIMSDIHAYIQAHHANDSGIIYFSTKRLCEEIAEALRRDYNISTRFYHAGLNRDDRIRVQQEWQRGDIKVICATVAFGMGIDKSDVRFVIHYSIPPSLEAYYQETGRAGRDGLESSCILFYSYQDKIILDMLIEKGEGSYQLKQMQKANIRQVIGFCENRVDCRRQQVLAYFDESFDPAKCRQRCDNCHKKQNYEVRDVSELAMQALEIVRYLERENPTLLYCVDIFRGTKSQKVLQAGHVSVPGYGVGKGLAKNDTERLFHLLVLKEIFMEKCKMTQAGFVAAYLKVGPRADLLSRGSLKIELPFLISTSASKPGKWIDDDSFENNDYQENISTVVPRAKSKPLPTKTKGQINVENDPENDPSDTGLTELQVHCFDRLKKKRTEICDKLRILPQYVFNDTVLRNLAKKLPIDIKSFVSTRGVTDESFEKYGLEFLAITRTHAEQRKSRTKTTKNEDEQASFSSHVRKYSYQPPPPPPPPPQANYNKISRTRSTNSRSKKTTAAHSAIQPLMPKKNQ